MELDTAALSLVILQLLQLLHDFTKIADFSLGPTFRRLITAPHIDRAQSFFFSADHKHKIVLCHLCIANLPVQFIVRDVHIHKVARVME